MPKKEPTALVGAIQKFSIEDGPGIRTSVFLKGCPLRCRWCHNPELIAFDQQLIQSPSNCIGCGACIKACPQHALSLDPEDGIDIDRNRCTVCLTCADKCTARALRPVAQRMSVPEVLDIVEQDKGFYDNTGGGMTVSGGEMLAHASFVGALIDGAQERGISVCLDTCGYGDIETLKLLTYRKNVTDILFDVKAIDEGIHRRFTGVGNRRILDNLRQLAADGECARKITVRVPLVEGVNCDSAQIEQIGALLMQCGIRRIDLLPYHTLGIGKQRNIGGVQEEFQEPDEQRLEEIRSYFEKSCHLKVGVLDRP